MHCHTVSFPREGGMNFHKTNLELHENGMQIHAWIDDEKVYSKTYYSIGGGFIVDEENFGKEAENPIKVPYEFTTAEELVNQCKESGLSISALVMKNEQALHSDEETRTYFANIWRTMRECMDRGMNEEGILPGPLRVPRRAAALRQQLLTSEKTTNDPMSVVDWVNMFAFAVNEENAAGGRVVTAPTNGACGIIPAVLAYYDKFIQTVTEKITSVTLPLLAQSVVFTSATRQSLVQRLAVRVKLVWHVLWRRLVLQSLWVVAQSKYVWQQKSRWSTT